MAPISTASEPESQQVSKRPRRQRRRKIPSSPPYERTTDRTFGSEGFNRLDTLVAAAGEETDWQVREEDDHSGQTTQRVRISPPDRLAFVSCSCPSMLSPVAASNQLH